MVALHGKRVSRRIARYCAAMSQENVEIIRRLVDAWNRQDIDGILALIRS